MNGNEMRKWRGQQFLSQENLALMLGVHVNTVQNWERQRTRLPASIELALEAITHQRRTMVTRLRRKKEDLAHQRRLKAIEQGLWDGKAPRAEQPG